MEGQLLGGDGGTRSGKRNKRDVGLWREGGHGGLERKNTGREAGRRENGISLPTLHPLQPASRSSGSISGLSLWVFFCVSLLWKRSQLS